MQVILHVAACIQDNSAQGVCQFFARRCWPVGASPQESEHLHFVDIQENFELGGHKAAAIALVLKKAEVYLVSDLEKDIVGKMFMKAFSDINGALKEAFSKFGDEAEVIVMPYGASTLPVTI